MTQVSNNEAVLALAKKIKDYDDANPEVGFPPLWWMHVDQALRQLGLDKTDIDYERIAGRKP